MIGMASAGFVQAYVCIPVLLLYKHITTFHFALQLFFAPFDNNPRFVQIFNPNFEHVHQFFKLLLVTPSKV